MIYESDAPMTFKTLSLAAATVCLTATSAFAATMTERYEVTSAVGSRADHSLWIQNGVTSTIRSDFDFAPSGIYSVFSDGSSVLSGTVVSQNDGGSGFDVSFDFSDTFPAHVSPGFKSENGSTHTSDLRLIDMIGGTLTGFGALAGLDLNVTRKPADYRFATQIGSAGTSGIGPNNKNGDYGMAFWMMIDFASTCTVCDQDAFSSLQGRQGDINVSLTPTTTTIPVPLPAGGLLLLSGFGAVVALRRRRRAS